MPVYLRRANEHLFSGAWAVLGLQGCLLVMDQQANRSYYVNLNVDIIC